jgi:hypothetical protein
MTEVFAPKMPGVRGVFLRLDYLEGERDEADSDNGPLG